MTNNFENNDDFNEHELGGPEEQGNGGARGNLAEAWRTRPIFKLTVLLIAVFVVGLTAFKFLGGGSSSDSSNDIAHLAKPPSMHEAPGGAVSPYMEKETKMADSTRTNDAIANGGSAMPTPIGQTTDVGNFGGTDKKDDALQELHAQIDKLNDEVRQDQAQRLQEKAVQAQQAQQVQRPPEQFDNSMAEAMQRQMQQLLDGWSPKGIKQVTVIKPDDLKAEAAKGATITPVSASTADAQNAAAANTTPKAKLLVPAGTVSYAQIMTEANSDVPGPILAQIVSGPLAGARAIGSFEVSQGYEKYLVLKFTVADKKGKDYQINAIALDPDTTLGGMATEVDERYLVRVVLPAAAGFLQGMGQALGQGSSSVTTDGTTSIATTSGNGFKQGIYNGMGQAANTMGQFFQDQANLTKPLVRVAAGTPMGLFFTAPVFDTDISSTPVTQQQGIGGYNGGYNSPYPGTNVNGYGYGNANNQQGGNPYPNYAGNNSAAANGAPYPNYANPSYGYTNTGVTRGTTPGGIAAPYNQINGFGQ